MIKRERARPMSADERRSAIVAAVVPLLAQHGGSVTTRQIAEAAGIAEGTIFRVFPDQRALFLAAAQETLNPPQGREDMAAGLAAAGSLREAVVLVTERMVARLEQGMLVMMALRSIFMAEGPPPHDHGHDRDATEPGGPPAFIVEANRQLLADLTDLLFTPYADQLRVPPERAALVLRSLVFGAWHPGVPAGERSLTPDDVAGVLLDGVLLRSDPGDR